MPIIKRLFSDQKIRPLYYKYIQSCLNAEIYRVFGKTSTTFDTWGTLQYQESVKKYLEVKLQIDCFSSNLKYATPKNVNLLQIADFIGGSIRMQYEGSYLDADHILSNCWKGKQRLPDSRIIARDHANSDTTADDLAVELFVVESIDRYLELNNGNSEKQVHCEIAKSIPWYQANASPWDILSKQLDNRSGDHKWRSCFLHCYSTKNYLTQRWVFSSGLRPSKFVCQSPRSYKLGDHGYL